MEHSVVAPPRLLPHHMEHGVATPLILSTLPMAVKGWFLILDLTRVPVQCVHCPMAPMVPFSMPKNMDYGGLLAYIKSKLIYLWPGVCYYLQSAQFKWWVAVWSFMKLENTHMVVEFIFKGIEPPCMVLG